MRISRFFNLMAKTLLILSVLFLVSCSSVKDKVEYFKKHPDEVMPTARECVTRAQKGKDIDSDVTCVSAFVYEQEKCEMQKRKGLIWGWQVDCNDKLEMMKRAYMGY